MADGFKKFTGFRRRKAPVKLSGVKSALFTVGLILVGIYFLRIGINKWTGITEDSVTLDIYECYRPQKEANLANAKKLIDAMKKEQVSSCPKETLSTPMNITNYGDSRVYHIVTSNLVAGDISDDDSRLVDIEPKNICNKYNIIETYQECYTLIAPFDFKFVNANTDGNTIVITNKQNNLRVTFSDVLGWFCSSAILDPASVKNHTSHGTVVGNSPNSYVTSGYAGNLIGFGDKNTSILCEEFKDSEWTAISLKSLLEAASRNN